MIAFLVIPLFIYEFGINKAAIRYARSPVPAQRTKISHIIRTIVGSISRYSAMPPQTPQSFLSFDFLNLLSLISAPVKYFKSGKIINAAFQCEKFNAVILSIMHNTFIFSFCKEQIF